MENENLGTPQWYVVNTYSGHENKVKINLERRVVSMGLENYVFRIIVAETEQQVLKDGIPTGKTKTKNSYPGYVFIEMIMSDEAWFMVRNTPGVTGFVGSSGGGTKPFPIPAEEIEPVLKSLGMVDKSMYSRYDVGDLVKILRGPLEGGEGHITEINSDNGTVKVETVFFGRSTIVEVDFSDIDKI